MPGSRALGSDHKQPQIRKREKGEAKDIQLLEYVMHAATAALSQKKRKRLEVRTVK